jgi:hypothetical protein
MDITILGYKLNVELLILIGIIYLILVTNTFCSCCNMPKLFESMKTMAKNLGDKQLR